MIINNKQQNELNKLLTNLEKFENKYGKITNLMLLSNPITKTSIYIKYEKHYVSSGDEKVDMILLEINSDGELINIGETFPNVYSRYAFLGECTPFDIKQLIVK